VNCEPIENLDAGLECSFQDGILVVTNGVVTDLVSNTAISMKVTGFKNPIDTSAVSGFTITSFAVDQVSGELFAISTRST